MLSTTARLPDATCMRSSWIVQLGPAACAILQQFAAVLFLGVPCRLMAQVPRLRSIFISLDADGDGTVSREEIERVPLDVLPERLFEHSHVSSMQASFFSLNLHSGAL